MFKYIMIMGVLPDSINQLFALYNERYNYNKRHNQDLQINTGKEEIVYKFFLVFVVYTYGIIKNIIGISYACFKNLAKHYLQTNAIIII